MVDGYGRVVRALRYHGRRDVRLEELDEPVVGPGDVLIRVAYNGLCGSDVHEYFEGPLTTSIDPHPLTGCSLPVILGHEIGGRVAGVGVDVSDVEVGSLVAVEPIQTCGTCPRCRAGHRHLCRRIAFHGYHRSGGGLAELTAVPRSMVHVLPSGLSARHAALVEPMAVSRRAVRRAGVDEGDVVVVHGGGPIGLGALLALRAGNVRTVVADPSATRRAAALILGAEEVIDPATEDVAASVRDLTDGLGAHASIDAAGVATVVAMALRSTRPDGTVVLVAHHHQPLSLRSGHLIFNEVAITGSSIYDADDVAWVIDAMGRGVYPLDGWIDVIELDRVVEDGFEALGEQRVNKVLVRLDAAS